jgi:N-acetyl-gamma-glutamyl-phosphate reductase common form
VKATTSSSRAQRSDLDVAVTTGAERRHETSVEALPALVLGGSGYVGGELLRLLAGHPRLKPAAIVSDSKPGVAVEEVFPHLAGALDGLTFIGRDALPRILGEHPRVAVFGAAPHGAAAPMVAELLGAARGAGSDVAVVDISADFRFANAAAWERVYGHPHGAPELLAGFFCAVPELAPVAELAEGVPSRAVAHPGCFTTATLLAAVPLLRAGLVEPSVTVVAVTGSTGAGRTPTPTTHHPERRSTLFAYSPLQHRHQPEMEALAAAAGAPASFHFVPQAGPFARGIHATLVMRPSSGATADDARATLASFYADSPFVDVLASPPRLQDVVGTNRCRLAVAADRDTLIAFSVLDNLVKGAAGGAIQWMNRLLSYSETAGLLTPGLGWL